MGRTAGQYAALTHPSEVESGKQSETGRERTAPLGTNEGDWGERYVPGRYKSLSLSLSDV
jgi:hypothetical protein